MPRDTKANNLLNFKTGALVTEDKLTTLFDSILFLDDADMNVNPNQSKITLGKGITVGFTNDEDGEAGTIRWNPALNGGSGGFEFHDGDGFTEFASGGGGGESPWSETTGQNIAFNTLGAGVAIGVDAPPTNVKLQIDGGSNVIASEPSGFLIIGDAGSDHIAFDATSIARKQGDSLGVLNINSSNLNLGGATVFLQGGNILIRSTDLETGIDLSSSGEIVASGDIDANGSITDLSDVRVKHKIEDFKLGLDELLKLSPKKYEFNGLGGTIDGKKSIGLIAQELESVFPDIIKIPEAKEDKKDSPYLRVRSNYLNYLLINAVKDLHAKVEALESQLNTQSYEQD